MLREVFSAAETLWYAMGGSGPYNAYLHTPPRVYDEDIASVLAIWVDPAWSMYAESTIRVAVLTNQVAWPGWGAWVYSFESETGRCLGRAASPFAVTDREVVRAADGTLFVRDYTDTIRTLNPLTLAREGASWPASWWGGAVSVTAFMMDPGRDLAVLRTSLEANDQVAVRTISTGALVRRCFVAGQVFGIFPEDGSRCYVLAGNGVLTLLDFTTGEVLGVSREPIAPGALTFRAAWDPLRRRLMTCDRTPDAQDGACTTRVRGYLPVPVPVGITTPVPLSAPRKGATVQILTRLYGDAGEPVGGGRIRAALTGPATLFSQTAPVSGEGFATFLAACAEAGDVTCEVSAEVP